jgi:hypothetical protein
MYNRWRPKHRSTRRATLLIALLAVALPTLPGTATAEPLPDPCKAHPTKVVNPGCVPAVLDEALGYEIAYPDLVPNVTEVKIRRPIFWDFEAQAVGYGPPELAFDTHAQNLGHVPLDLLADDPTNQATSTVSQCIAWTTDFVCRERVQVGGFTWHEVHKHFHFEDFGAYQFRRTLADGSPDYSTSGLVAVSDKVSFCLIDSDTVREDAFPVERYRNCSEINQGISPGWTDIYGSGLAGQQFSLVGVPDGRYVVIVDMDTSNHVFETDEIHNRVEVTVDVTTNPDSAVIVGRRYL